MKSFFRTLLWLIAIAFWCASFYLLLSKCPYTGPISVPSHGAHTVLFFGLAFMTTCAQQRPNIVLTLAALYFFGGMTEVAQHFTPPRTCDLLDFMEDVIGSTAGVFAVFACMPLFRKILRLWQGRFTRSQAAVSHVS